MNSGIYKITNISTKDFYVGSSYNMINRKRVHFNQLNKNIHNNKYLQNSYNKYSKDSFQFEIVAYCPKEYLLKLEQWFIDNLKPKFNELKLAGNSLGYKHNQDSLQKLKTQNKEYCSKKLYQYNNQELIKVWDSCNEYAKYYNINRAAVYKALRKGYQCAGYTITRQPASL